MSIFHDFFLSKAKFCYVLGFKLLPLVLAPLFDAIIFEVWLARTCVVEVFDWYPSSLIIADDDMPLLYLFTGAWLDPPSTFLFVDEDEEVIELVVL